MKHYFTAILFLLFASINSVFAIHSFVNESKLWHCKKWKQGFSTQEDKYYYFQGDTVINGITAKKMYLKFNKESNNGNYQASLYENAKKVYCCYPNQKDFNLIYDFGAKEGEKLVIDGMVYKVDGVKEIFVNNQSLRVLYLSYTEGGEKYQFTWVQGFGGESAPLNSGPKFPGSYENFISCEMDGKNVLKSEDILNKTTSTKTYKIELDRDNFEFVNFKGYLEICPIDDWIYYEEIINAPMILYQSFEIVLPEQEKVKNISFTVGECTQIPDAILIPYWGAVHSGTDASDARTVDIPYEIKDYPFEFEYHEPATNGRRTVVVSFNIFAYNAITKTISWPEDFSITVETEPLEQWEYVSWAMPDGWGLLEDIDPYLNPEDFWKGKKIPSIVGSVWSYVNYATTTNGQEAYNFFRYTVLNEPKEMNGHTYYPMVKYNTCEYIPSKEELRVYLREEGCRIYKYLEQEGEETLLYDFAIQPYDQYFKEQHNYFKTENGKALNITKQEKCTTAEDGFPFRKMVIGDNMTWIDGIGNIKDFLAEYDTQLEGTSVLNYYRSGNGQVVYKNAFSNLTSYKADDCALGANAVKEISILERANIQATGSTILCTSPTATKFEIYTMDAVKVGEAAFANGEATVKVDQTPATYLYIVTYPNGQRESGKVTVKN